MNWHKKEITKSILMLALCLLLLAGALAFVIYLLVEERGGAVILIFIAMLLYFGLMTWGGFKNLIESVSKYKESTTSNMLSDLKGVDTYKSYENMQSAYQVQRQHSIYADDKLVITDDFVASQDGHYLFITNGILDAKVNINKVNGMTEYVSLNILYYDGKSYEFKYTRTLTRNMEITVSNVERAAGIIAFRGANFKKFPSHTF